MYRIAAVVAIAVAVYWGYRRRRRGATSGVVKKGNVYLPNIGVDIVLEPSVITDRDVEITPSNGSTAVVLERDIRTVDREVVDDHLLIDGMRYDDEQPFGRRLDPGELTLSREPEALARFYEASPIRGVLGVTTGDTQATTAVQVVGRPAETTGPLFDHDQGELNLHSVLPDTVFTVITTASSIDRIAVAGAGRLSRVEWLSKPYRSPDGLLAVDFRVRTANPFETVHIVTNQ
jgi:hypothetical protein